MSELALRERSARQVWAAPGSRHDRLIALLRVVLPCAIGVLAAFLVTAPLTTAGDVSFVLDKHKVEVAHERLRIEAAQYRGSDTKGEPFTLSARNAVQKSSAEPIVRIAGLAAAITLADGPAHVEAESARYNMGSQQIAMDGPLRFQGPHAYTLATTGGTIDLKSHMLMSGSAVSGTLPQGAFSADRLMANLDERSVSLDGHAHLRIVPGRTK